MAVRCAGEITYVGLVEKNDKVKLRVAGTTNIAKGILDWMGKFIWDTSWRFYDPYGRLLYRDDRHHSIVPLTTLDSATDDFEVRLPRQSYYQIQLYGPCVGVLATETFSISEAPKIKPPPEVPWPAPSEPVEPAPSLPTATTPTPAPTPAPSWLPEDIKKYLPYILIGGAAIILITMKK